MIAFLRSAALAFVLLLAAVATLTVVMDPYDYWGSPRVAGLNARRPDANTQLVAMKAHQYARIAPATVIAGNSRVQVGFDPEAPAWSAANRPVYNYGMPGMGFAGLEREIERAIAAHPPATLLVGLDLIDFRVSAADWRGWRPSPPPPARGLAARADEVAQVSLSLSALVDSLAEFAEQRSRFPRDVTVRGFEAPGGYQGQVAAEGHAALFAQRNRENYRGYAAGPKAVRWPEPGGSDAWDALDRLDRVARARGVRMVLFTYPYHADILVGFEREGLLPALFDFKRALADFGAARGVPVWDFSRINATTAEPVPAPGDRHTHMSGYWEAGHFKAALGERMVATMMSGRPSELGEPLTLTDVDAANAGLATDIRTLAADPARAARLAPAFAYAESR